MIVVFEGHFPRISRLIFSVAAQVPVRKEQDLFAFTKAVGQDMFKGFSR